MSMVDIDPENLADEENFSGLMPFLADAVKKRIIEDDIDGLRIIESEVRNLAQQLVIFADTIEIRKKEYKRIKNKMRDLEEQARLQQQTIEALRSNMLAEFGISEDESEIDLSIPEFQDTSTSLDVDLDSTDDDDLLSYYSDGKDLSVFNFDDDDGDDDLLADLGFGYVDDAPSNYSTDVTSNTGSVGAANSNASTAGMMIPDFEDDFDLTSLVNTSAISDDMFSTSTPQTTTNTNTSSNSSGFDPYHFGDNQSSGGGSSPFSDGSNGVGAPFVAANNNTNTSTISFEQISPFSPASMFSDDDEDNEYVETDSIEDIYAEDDEYKKQLAHEKALLSQKSQNRVYSDEQMTVNNNVNEDEEDGDGDGDSETDGSNAPLVHGMSLDGFTSQIVLDENNGIGDGNNDDYEDIIDDNFFAI